MLCLSIKHNDGFTIGPDITVRVHKKSPDQVKVIIIAPRNLKIERINAGQISQRLAKKPME